MHVLHCSQVIYNVLLKENETVTATGQQMIYFAYYIIIDIWYMSVMKKGLLKENDW